MHVLLDVRAVACNLQTG